MIYRVSFLLTILRSFVIFSTSQTQDNVPESKVRTLNQLLMPKFGLCNQGTQSLQKAAESRRYCQEMAFRHLLSRNTNARGHQLETCILSRDATLLKDLGKVEPRCLRPKKDFLSGDCLRESGTNYNRVWKRQ